ncbi:MAG: hypothetical protein AAF766_13655 [Cyanobacteria bacterium P01_D01_bin.14]
MVDAANRDLTTLEAGRALPPEIDGPEIDGPKIEALVPGIDVPDAPADVPDIVDVIEAEIEAEAEPDVTTGQKLLKRLYDYRDRSLEKYGRR